NDHVAAARIQASAKAAQLHWLQELQSEAQMLRAHNRAGSAQGTDKSILAVIDTTSRRSGLAAAIRRIQPSNADEAIVTLDEANFNQILSWPHALHRDYAIHITSLSVTRDDKPGRVQARLKLHRDPA